RCLSDWSSDVCSSDLIAVVCTLMPARHAHAQAPGGGSNAGAGSGSASPEDEQLYPCKKRTGQVAVTFKPETELKDLIAWAMSFKIGRASCRERGEVRR